MSIKINLEFETRIDIDFLAKGISFRLSLQWAEGRDEKGSVMANILDIEKIRTLVASDKYEFSKHADRKRELDMIYIWELSTGQKN